LWWGLCEEEDGWSFGSCSVRDTEREVSRDRKCQMDEMRTRGREVLVSLLRPGGEGNRRDGQSWEVSARRHP
jgi:hypothetical protein